jgi:hypothetical protein
MGCEEVYWDLQVPKKTENFFTLSTINLVAPWISIVRKCMAHKILRTALKL